ncbi:hypothetical protein RVD_152 [viral metagenome]
MRFARTGVTKMSWDMLMEMALESDPRLATGMKLLRTFSETIGVLVDEGASGSDLRSSLKDTPKAQLSLYVVAGVIAKRVNETGAQTWKDVDWEEIIPADMSSGLAQVLITPLMKLEGPISQDSGEVVKVLLKAITNKATITGMVMKVNKLRKEKRSEERVDDGTRDRSESRQDRSVRRPRPQEKAKRSRFGFFDSQT